MSQQRQSPSETAHVEALDTLSSIWIVASNDENPEISYAGLCYRFHISSDAVVRELVAAHGELFRLTIPAPRLTSLKKRYRLGKSLPSWLRSILDDDDRNNRIDELREEDFFRSQFRAHAGAPPSQIQIVDWGLQHIERLRKARMEIKDERLKRWSSLWIPLMSTAIALLALSTTAFLQLRISRIQWDQKQYEVSFRPKVDGYTHFIQALYPSFNQAINRDISETLHTLGNADDGFVQLEPFLERATRDRIWIDYQNLVTFCLTTAQRENRADGGSDSLVSEFINRRERLRTELYDALFQ